jgi:hypothetical protein
MRLEIPSERGSRAKKPWLAWGQKLENRSQLELDPSPQQQRATKRIRTVVNAMSVRAKIRSHGDPRIVSMSFLRFAVYDLTLLTLWQYI